MIGDDAFRYIGNKPAQELAPGLLKIVLGRFVLKAGAPKVADEPCGGATEPVALGDQCGMDLIKVVGDNGKHTCARFDVSHPVQHAEERQFFEARAFCRFGRVESEPGLEPAFAGEIEAKGELTRRRWGTVKIDGEHGADGRAVVIAFMEGFGAAEHEQTGAAFGDELLQEGELITGEETCLDIIEDDGVIGKRSSAVLGKPPASSAAIAGM
jgi:hypothetical protein